MYKIELNCWYQERGGFNQKEFYRDMGFITIEEACTYLAMNIDFIMDEYPVESIEIRFVILG